MPYGDFVIDGASDAVLLAGGTGISAFTAFLEALKPESKQKVTLIYGARNPRLFLSQEMGLSQLAKVPGFNVMSFSETADASFAERMAALPKPPQCFTGRIALSSVLGPPSSDSRPLSSVIGHPSSVLRPPASDIGPLTSDLRPLSLKPVLCHPSSVLRLLSSVIGPPSSVLRLLPLRPTGHVEVFGCRPPRAGRPPGEHPHRRLGMKPISDPRTLIYVVVICPLSSDL